MGGTSINDQENRVCGASDEALEKFNEDGGIDTALLLDYEFWPREVIAEITLMPWRAPVVSTTGVSPFLPQLRPV
jgi:hypothetical protein